MLIWSCPSVARWLTVVRLAAGCILALVMLLRAAAADDKDPTGGWTAGDIGFRANARVPVASEVEIRLVKIGNSRGVVVTYSGNPNAYEPGKIWTRQELREGGVYKYQIGPALAQQLLAVRSGAAQGGFDSPRKVESVDGGSRLHFAGGRVVDVIVRRPKPSR